MTDTVQSPDEARPAGVAPMAVTDAYPLSALQTGMLFHSELVPGSATYHDLFTLTLEGEYRRAALAAALAEVTAPHPVLRTSFNLTDFTEPTMTPRSLTSESTSRKPRLGSCLGSPRSSNRCIGGPMPRAFRF